ncbi:MAG: DUF4215 domain-containing protein [Nanobdellota archaeon]
MMKRGKDYIFLILISIVSLITFSNFISAACTPASQPIVCSYISDPYECQMTYGTYCYYDGSTCRNKGAPGEITCSDVYEQNLCTSKIGCTWSTPTVYCGDNLCNNGETCTSCPGDCGEWISADGCKGTMNCNYVDDPGTCYMTYGTYCYWNDIDDLCMNKGAIADCEFVENKDLCTSAINCYWSFGSVFVCTKCSTVCSYPASWNDCDCDGQCDEYVSQDINNCGACENICPTGVHSTPICYSGECGFSCAAYWGDCTTSPGCETSLLTTSNCGVCGNACGAGEVCSNDNYYETYQCDCNPTNCGTRVCGPDPTGCDPSSTACGSCPGGQTCTSAGQCQTTQVCGNGMKEGTEGCDDGNTMFGDGCSSTCTVESGWNCVTTTGTSQNPDTICTPICGNGIKQTGEGCDDGDTSSGDGCSSTCTVESGWTCNTATPNVCTRLCGNGVINSGEGCDDGDTSSGDGCSSTCTVESGWTCVGTAPSVCTKDCTPTKTSCDSDDCGSVPNGCGVYLSCGGCSGGEQCESNTCQCVSSSDVTCYNDDVYRVDSCGNTITTSKVEECNKGNSCYDYYCSGGACRADYTCGCNGDNSKCADTDLCTIDTCASDGTCDYTYRTCGTNNDGCCRPGCTYLQDNDCDAPTPECGDGSINQDSEECDCGTDGFCSSSELGGETCSSWDSRYSGGTLGCSFCQIITTMCTEPCSLENAYWSTASTYVDSEVDLIVTGSSNCNGKSITFEVFRDVSVGFDSSVATLSSRIMSSGNVVNSWTPTETSPNNGYYFIAEISDGSDSLKSDALEVLENTGCWDGICGDGENCNNCPDDCKSCCGNGICDSNECITCPGDCSDCEIPCGNGICESELGENCNNCADCPLCPPENCGNGNIDSGEVCDGANLGGETCISQGYGGGDLKCAWNCQSFDVGECTGEPPEECEINSPTWNVTTALEGTPVRLNFNAVNCNGETISFVVLEKDGGVLDLNRDEPAQVNPVSFVYSSSNNYGTWYAEGQDDDDETGGESYPPEYYFKVIVNDEEKAESSNENLNDPLLLRVESEDITCAGINYCADYDNQEDCEDDALLCNVGEASVFGVTCGSVYNDATQCWDNIICGCSWNSGEGVCQGGWEAESDCGEDNGCVPYESDCWLAGDLCTDECTCFGTSTPNGDGSCDYSGSDVCDNTKECWLAGDHCEDDCTCEDGYPSNNDGTCGDDNPNVCIEDIYENDCWLVGDLCTDECTCFGTSTPNGDGSCDYSGSDVCGEEDQCWLVGDHCEDDCTCEDGYYPNNEGICVDEDGGSGGIIRKKGTCSYAETGEDTCEDSYLDRVLDAIWQWDSSNSYTEIPAGENEADYIQDTEYSVYRYDPERKSQLCTDIQDRFLCPASVEVPFFGIYQLVIALTIIGLVYLMLILKRKK